MIDSKSKDISNFYDSISNINALQGDSETQTFGSDIEEINDDSSHYFCTKCLKFPFIKFCKDRKNIRLTCSCFNNKKILIEDLFLFDSKYNFLTKNTNFIKTNNSTKNSFEKELLCKKHEKIFNCFSTNLMDNCCLDCIEESENDENNNIIYFNDIKLEKQKILQLIEKINPHDDKFLNNIKIIDNNNSYYEKLSEEEGKRFKKLINIIINDYKKYPNFSHYFNIKNLLHFFNIEDKPIIVKEKKNSMIY